MTIAVDWYVNFIKQQQQKKFLSNMMNASKWIAQA